MARPSLYDRIAAKRIADEEAARLAALQAPVVEAAPEPEPQAVTPLQEGPSHFSFGGLQVSLPAHARLLAVQATVDYNGEPLTVTIKRSTVREGDVLGVLFERALQAFSAQAPGLRVIRQQGCTLLGCDAQAVDVHINAQGKAQHARLIGALVPQAGSEALQWLEVSCQIDPTQSELSGWLTHFDSLVADLAAG